MNGHRANRIITLPNLLTILRLILIPVFVLALRRSPRFACVILLISGLTDILDGYIARRFHMVSNTGKILDPVADKLTVFVCLLCLSRKHTVLLFPLCFLVCKECLMGLLLLLSIQKSGIIHSSKWHGKVCTVLLYGILCLHLLYPSVPVTHSKVLVNLSCGMMLYSFLAYTQSSLSLIRGKGNPP